LNFGESEIDRRALNVVLSSGRRMGLDQVTGERGVKLNVGEKQRLSIARALFKNPPILILDQAIASVDTRIGKIVIERHIGVPSL
jgi:ABC-type multidrug transport system fused ATPase/permease subunit